MAAKPKNAGSINVSVAMLGDSLRVYELPAKSTVADALSAAGINGQAGELRVDAKTAKATDRLAHGQIVTVVQKVQGG